MIRRLLLGTLLALGLPALALAGDVVCSSSNLFSCGGQNLTAVGTDIIPTSNNAKDLGSASFKWRTLYIGTQVSLPVGSSGTLSIVLPGGGGLYETSGYPVLYFGGNGLQVTNIAGKRANVGGGLAISSADGALNGDAGIKAVAAKVVAPQDGADVSTLSWLQNTGGRSMLTADYTNATTTFSNTVLSHTLVSGRKYTAKLVIFLSDSLAADGAKLDFNGGTATMTNFRAHCTLFDTALLASQQGTTLAAVFNAGTVTGSGYYECYMAMEPSGNGTFIVRLAQNAHTTGTLTAFRGSNLWVEDMP